MQDTDERAIRGLLAHQVAGDEPPLGPLLGDVVRTGIRVRRRRRVAGAVGSTALVAVVAAGIPAAVSQLGGPAPSGAAAAAGHNPHPFKIIKRLGIQGSKGGRDVYDAARVPAWFHFVTPRVRGGSWARPLVAITDKSAAQLLLDQTTAGAHVSSVKATLKETGNQAGAEIGLRNAAGTGTVEMQMSPPGLEQTPECLSVQLVACRSYTLPNGVRVQEGLEVAADGSGGHDYMLGLTVWWPHHGVSVAFASMNYFLSGSAAARSAAPPVRMAPLLKAALDRRWDWHMNKGFVAQARHLKLDGDSGKPWG
jgi:hypothetical protein